MSSRSRRQWKSFCDMPGAYPRSKNLLTFVIHEDVHLRYLLHDSVSQKYSVSPKCRDYSVCIHWAVPLSPADICVPGRLELSEEIFAGSNWNLSVRSSFTIVNNQVMLDIGRITTCSPGKVLQFYSMWLGRVQSRAMADHRNIYCDILDPPDFDWHDFPGKQNL